MIRRLPTAQEIKRLLSEKPVDAKGQPSTWLPSFLNAAIDGLFLITGGTQKAVNDEFTQLASLA